MNEFEDILTTLLKQLADEFKEVLKIVLASKKLSDEYANITEDLQVHFRDNSLQIYIYNYYKYIESGRKRGAKRPPISALIKWLKDPKKRIRKFRDKKGRFISINQTAYIIQNAIYKNGIKPRPFIAEAQEMLLERASKQIDEVIIKGVLDNLIIRKFINKK